MNTKAMQRLADLEERERRWRESISDFKCHKCGAVIGRWDWRYSEAGPHNDFSPPRPHRLRIREATAQGPVVFRSDPLREVTEDTPPPPPFDPGYKDPPGVADLWDGITCHQCSAETRWEGGVAKPFPYADELRKLRRRKYAAQQRCNEPSDLVP